MLWYQIMPLLCYLSLSLVLVLAGFQSGFLNVAACCHRGCAHTRRVSNIIILLNEMVASWFGRGLKILENNMTIRMADAEIDADDVDAVLDVLHSGRLTMGQKTEEFERLAAAYCGAK